MREISLPRGWDSNPHTLVFAVSVLTINKMTAWYLSLHLWQKVKAFRHNIRPPGIRPPFNLLDQLMKLPLLMSLTDKKLIHHSFYNHIPLNCLQLRKASTQNSYRYLSHSLNSTIFLLTGKIQPLDQMVFRITFSINSLPKPKSY